MCLFQKALSSQSKAPLWPTALWLVQMDTVPNTRSRPSAGFTVKTVSLSPRTAPPLNIPALPPHWRGWDPQSTKNQKLPPSTAETGAARAGQVRTQDRKVIVYTVHVTEVCWWTKCAGAQTDLKQHHSITSCRQIRFYFVFRLIRHLKVELQVLLTAFLILQKDFSHPCRFFSYSNKRIQ